MKRIASLFLAFVIVFSLAVTFVSAEGATDTISVNGRDYVTDTTKKLAYALIERIDSVKSIDVISNFKTSEEDDDNWVKTAFSYSGFRANKVTNGLKLTPSANFLFNGNYIQVIFTVTAEKDVEDGMLGIYYDVQIADNDYAQLNAITSNGRIIGFDMTDDHANCSSKDAKLSVYFREMTGVTDADTYWFGSYYDETGGLFVSMEDPSGAALYKSQYDSNYLKDENGNLIGLKGADSTINFTWGNINLQAGESKTFSVIIGVGNAQSDAPVITSVAKVADGYVVKGTQVGEYEKNNFGVFYKIDNGDIEGSTAPITWDGDNFTTTIPVDITSLTPGEHKITFNAINNYGTFSNYVEQPISIANIEEPEIPTTPEAPKDDVVTIDEPQIPLAQNPKTNAGKTGLAVCATIITMCGGIALVSSKGRKKSNNK